MCPLYGAKRAPLRLYRKLNSACTQMSWKALTSVPCVYRYVGKSKFCVVCATHVDDILFAGNRTGMLAFERVVAQFTNSGISHLGDANPLVYLGLDIQMEGIPIQISQQPYAEEKIREVLLIN